MQVNIPAPDTAAQPAASITLLLRTTVPTSAVPSSRPTAAGRRCKHLTKTAGTATPATFARESQDYHGDVPFRQRPVSLLLRQSLNNLHCQRSAQRFEPSGAGAVFPRPSVSDWNLRVFTGGVQKRPLDPILTGSDGVSDVRLVCAPTGQTTLTSQVPDHSRSYRGGAA
jgi:hypothetical protein